MRRQKLRESGELRGSAVRRGDGRDRGREQADGWKQKEKNREVLGRYGREEIRGRNGQKKNQ